MALAQSEIRSVVDGRAAPEGAGCVCPACRGALGERACEWLCAGCGRAYPRVAGVPDLRLHSDRYLSLRADREKALRLAEQADERSFAGLATAYYAMTDDVDAHRRALYMSHLLGAVERGRVLAGLLPKEGRVLEVGCGSGGLMGAYAQRLASAEVIGVDIALRWLVLARKRLEECARGEHVALVAASAEQLPWRDGWFDAVAADSVLEHLDDPALALREWARVLRPGGRLVVWSPNRFSLARDPHVGLWGVGWMPRGLACRYVRMMRRCEWHLQLLSARHAARLAVDAGFEEVRIEPAPAPTMTRPPERWPWLLCAYEALRRLPLCGSVLRSVGPLWQLTAVRGRGGGR